MDKPTPKERVQHIINALQLICHFVEGENEVSFMKDIKPKLINRRFEKSNYLI